VIARSGADSCSRSVVAALAKALAESGATTDGIDGNDYSWHLFASVETVTS